MILKENNIELIRSEKKTKGVDDRFVILEDSDSGHCCFEYSILDTEKINEVWSEKYESICETFDIESAESICEALNGRLRK